MRFRRPPTSSRATDLRLPVKQVRAADAALAQSLAAIQSANAEAAQANAPRDIGETLVNRETAVERRVVGEWVEVATYSDIVLLLAKEAQVVSFAQPDQSADANVSDGQGHLEGSAPRGSLWSGRDINDILVELERVRTLSDSIAQMTFRDLSRLRLNANTNATIGRMRSDPLTGTKVMKVLLVSGDFYALLDQLPDKTGFEVDVPRVQTTTKSGDFEIKNDTFGARFVNYDQEQLLINDGVQTIETGGNEGLVLSNQKAERVAVLDAPGLVSLPLDQILYDGFAPLIWNRFASAEAYWGDVAIDPGLNQMRVSEWSVRNTRFDTIRLPPRTYHRRVAALDRLSLPDNGANHSLSFCAKTIRRRS